MNFPLILLRSSSSCSHKFQERNKRGGVRRVSRLLFVNLPLVATDAHPFARLIVTNNVRIAGTYVLFYVQVAQGQRKARSRTQPPAGATALEGFRTVCQPGSDAMGSSHRQPRQVIGLYCFSHFPAIQALGSCSAHRTLPPPPPSINTWNTFSHPTHTWLEE